MNVKIDFAVFFRMVIAQLERNQIKINHGKFNNFSRNYERSEYGIKRSSLRSKKSRHFSFIDFQSFSAFFQKIDQQ